MSVRLQLFGPTEGSALVHERQGDHIPLMWTFIDDALKREAPSAILESLQIKEQDLAIDGILYHGYGITLDVFVNQTSATPEGMRKMENKLESAIGVALLELFSFIAVELVTTVTSPEGGRRGPDSRPLRGDRGV